MSGILGRSKLVVMLDDANFSLNVSVAPITAEDVREKMWTCSMCKESGVVRVKEIDGKYNFVKSMIGDHQNLSKDCYRENGSFFVSTVKGD